MILETSRGFMTDFYFLDNFFICLVVTKILRYIGKHAAGYFPITLHVEDIKAFDPDQAYGELLFVSFAADSSSFCLVTSRTRRCLWVFMLLSATPDSYFYLIAKFSQAVLVFYTPFLRHIWTWLGLVPASRKNFYAYLEAGYSCLIIPGGVQEMFCMNNFCEVAFLKSRKGFVQIAMEMGRPIVPVFCFGQNHVVWWWKPSGKFFAQISRAMKFTPILLWGRLGYLTNPILALIMPINEVHPQFVHALQELFEKYKCKVGYPDLELTIL
ncbi:hypothetical protein C4D60_Mb05t25620 [Musa balbisiana]|uniref:Acyltransferase n=1 Tax=Musa balbisiana TaxID=52838 RepID=A0A4S8JYS9_MUSBA|nr:hypothetical protein C4D60_Mb05t25620 [Musa balbisiana]